MSFNNRIRLPFKLHKPQFVEEAERYRKANGETITLSVVVRKVYEGLTDSIPEKLHERLKIALVHDHVEVEGDKYVGVIAQDGDYQIEWQDFLSHPLAQGKFKAEVTPFNATNSNCGTCQEQIQVVCVDDDAGILAEDTTYIIDVLANDQICCNPVVLSLLTYDTNYIQSASITVDSKIQIHTQPTLPDLPTVQIMTYRAECANGQFDEAAVFAALDGSIPACEPPTLLNVTDITETTATVNYTEAAGATGYYFQIRRQPDNYLIADAHIAPTDHVDCTGLVAATTYRFYIQTDCGGGNLSPFVFIDFTTSSPTPSNSCGQYRLFNTDDQEFRGFDYVECDGTESGNVNIPPLHERIICALQFSPGNPVDIAADGTITITYLGLC